MSPNYYFKTVLSAKVDPDFNMIPGGYCRDCKWWDNPPYWGDYPHWGDYPDRRCWRACGQPKDRALFEVWAVDCDDVATAPDFGCVQWQAREVTG